MQNDYDMGEIGFDPLGLCPTDPKEKYDMQTKELNNGRCALASSLFFVYLWVMPLCAIYDATVHDIPVWSALCAIVMWVRGVCVAPTQTLVRLHLK